MQNVDSAPAPSPESAVHSKVTRKLRVSLMPLVVTQLRVTAEFQAVLFSNSAKGVTHLNHIILTYFSVGHELKFRHCSSAVICQYIVAEF